MSTTVITVDPPVTQPQSPTDDALSTKSKKSRGRTSPKVKISKDAIQKIDPLRALEPARKKLCMLESQRVMSVFDDTIKRAEIMTLMPFILENLERFNVAFGSDLVNLLVIHKQIMDTYEEIRETLNKQRSESARSSKSGKTKSRQSVTIDDGEIIDDGERPEDENFERDISDMEREMTGIDISGHTGQDEDKTNISADVSKTPGTVCSATTPIDIVMKQLSHVAEQLSNSCKNVLRAFVGNPEAISTVLAEYRRRTENCDQFCVSLSELREILLGKLLMTPIEAKEKTAYLEEIALRERQNAVAIAKLEADLATNNADKDAEIKKRNEIIRKLQGDLHQIERISDENIRRMKSDAEKQEVSDTKNSEGRQTKLQNDRSYQKAQLQTLRDEHKEMESNLRKKKFKVETEVENWILKYDTDMGERQDEYEEIDAIYTEEKKQLHELEERFKTLEEEYTKILEERRREREEREAAEREMHIMVRCATTIQAFWRSFKVRKMLKAKKKGKGKGKGKGKKK